MFKLTKPEDLSAKTVVGRLSSLYWDKTKISVMLLVRKVEGMLLANPIAVNFIIDGVVEINDEEKSVSFISNGKEFNFVWQVSYPTRKDYPALVTFEVETCVHNYTCEGGKELYLISGTVQNVFVKKHVIKQKAIAVVSTRPILRVKPQPVEVVPVEVIPAKPAKAVVKKLTPAKPKPKYRSNPLQDLKELGQNEWSEAYQEEEEINFSYV